MHFHANGKLLISGEYLVLDGALALAVPTRFGQNLQVTEGKDGEACTGAAPTATGTSGWKNIFSRMISANPSNMPTAT